MIDLTATVAGVGVDLVVATDVPDSNPLTVTVAQGGTSGPVRGLDSVVGHGGLIATTAYAVGYNTPATFQAEAGGQASAAVTVTVISGDAWLRDVLYPSLSVPVRIVTHQETSRETRTALLRPVGARNPVAVTDVREGGKGTSVFATWSRAERDGFLRLVESGHIMLLTGPHSWQLGPTYLTMLAVTERRPGIADDETRLWTVEWVEVDPPVELLPGTPQTWQQATATDPTWALMRAKDWSQVLYPQAAG